MNEDEYMKSYRAWKWDGLTCPALWNPFNDEALVFDDSQFFPARDGTWLMVDYIPESGNWYITEGV